MVRASKLALGGGVVLVWGGIGAAYSGTLSGIVSPEQLPQPPVAVGIAIVTLVVAIVLSSLLDRRAWKSTGSAVGLTPGGAQFHTDPSEDGGKSLFGEPTLSGTVDGRPVRAWTYSVSSGSEGSSKTYTVVEAQLQTPVEWTATLGTDIQGTTPDHDIEAVQGQDVGDIGVRGDVPDDIADGVITAQVRDTLAGLDGEVSVGDVKSSVVSGMMDALDGADSMGASFAEGMLSMASDDDDAGRSRTVTSRERGLLLDEHEFQARIDAVTTVADAVDRASASAT